MAPVSTAERNRRKRERKKREREEQRKLEQDKLSTAVTAANDDKQQLKNDQPQVEIEYVAEQVVAVEGGGDAFEALLRFQERAAAIVVSDDERFNAAAAAAGADVDDDDDDDEFNRESISKRKIRDMLRPSLAELKRGVNRPDLVEAHDVTATDPEFLIQLKAVPGTVPVPRHWGRKRKYLQGKVRSIMLCYVLFCYVVLFGSTHTHLDTWVLLDVRVCMNIHSTKGKSSQTHSFLFLTERI
jgi:splicing factor 3B subunit 2